MPLIGKNPAQGPKHWPKKPLSINEKRVEGWKRMQLSIIGFLVGLIIFLAPDQIFVRGDVILKAEWLDWAGAALCILSLWGFWFGWKLRYNTKK